MAYRTPAEAKIYIKNAQRRIRLGYADCIAIRDNYGNPRGFIHRGKAVAYSSRRGSLAPTILDGLINNAYGDSSVDGKLRLIKLVRYERENGTTRGYAGF